MEEEEIELWYEENKQKLSDLYIKSIDKGMNVRQREVKFNKAMDKLVVEYERKHTKLIRKKYNHKRRQVFKKHMVYPFVLFWNAITGLCSFIGSSIHGSVKTKCGHVHYHASVLRIRHGYKITDGVTTFFRPVFYWYVKYLQRSVIVFTKPFVCVGKFFKKKAIRTKDFVMYLCASIWEYTKKLAKLIAKVSKKVYKIVSGKYSEVSKKYTEWYAKRVQKSADKKQARKEAREKKLKDKEEAKKRSEAEKSGETIEGDDNDTSQTAPEEALDAEKIN
ncbi:MAG: hypothetical protein U9P44_03425 [archaeon]|nr:hypothetical protein [archaeon]